MRAFTIKREYADKIVNGTKRYEVRRFRTDYRGPVVITVAVEKIALCIVDLVDIVPTNTVRELTAIEREYGHWAFKLTNPRRVEPMAVQGKLGLWEWSYPLPTVIVS